MKLLAISTVCLLVSVPVYAQGLTRPQCEAMADLTRGIAQDRDVGVTREREIENLKSIAEVNPQIKPMLKTLIQTINNVYDSSDEPTTLAGKVFSGCETLSGR